MITVYRHLYFFDLEINCCDYIKILGKFSQYRDCKIDWRRLVRFPSATETLLSLPQYTLPLRPSQTLLQNQQSEFAQVRFFPSGAEFKNECNPISDCLHISISWLVIKLIINLIRQTLVNNQLDAKSFYIIISLLQSSTCFEQRRAHHQEVKLY